MAAVLVARIVLRSAAARNALVARADAALQTGRIAEAGVCLYMQAFTIRITPPMATKAQIEENWSRCTCQRLRKLTRRVTQLYDQNLAPSGLTSSQFGLLALLSARDDASIGALAERLMMDPTSLTRTLRPLEQRRLIRIAAARDDRRRRDVTITDAGRAAFREAAPLWRKAQNELAESMGDRFDALDRSLDLSLKQLANA